MRIEDAIEVFANGFAYTRSLTHPYEVARLGPLIVMRDAPRKRGPYRIEEFLVSGVPPDEAVGIIRGYDPARQFLCAIEPTEADHDAIKAEYKRLGYRHLRREPLFVRDLIEPVEAPDPSTFVRVRTEEQARLAAEAMGKRPLSRTLLDQDDAPMRLFVAVVDEAVIGWVQSIRCGEAAWVANMYVREEHRRKGIASSLLRTLLADDHRLGIRHSVLLASAAGSKLYPTVGYRQIGLLQSFMPRKAACD